MNEIRCPKCSTSMEQGFLFDRSYDEYGKATDWVEGQPESSFWVGVKTAGRPRYRVVSWRCPQCGFIELYARPEGEST